MFRWLIMPALLLAAAFGYSQGCNIGPPTVQIYQGGAPVTTPVMGDRFLALRVTFNYQGPPSSFRIKFWLANQVRYVDVANAAPGTYVYQTPAISMPIDGIVPYGVTLDDLHQSGDSTPNNNEFSSTFEPVPPTAAVDWYQPRTLTGSMTFDTTYTASQPFHWITWFPALITCSHQEILEIKPPKYSSVVYTTPFNQPVYFNDTLLEQSGTLHQEMNFTFVARNVRSNWRVLNRIRWSGLANPPADVAPYLQPEEIVEVNSPEVQMLVSGALPSNYATTMTPYETARALFKAVVAHVTYGSGGWSAATTLSTGFGDCGGFSVAFMAACRKVGIPARPAVGGSEFGPHMWCEFWLGPEVGWVPVDVQTCDSFDPDGQFAYCFGYVPYLNNRLAVSWCCDKYSLFNGYPYGTRLQQGVNAWSTNGWTSLSYTQQTSFH